MRAYLNRYRDQPKTLRACAKKLERFLLWAVVLRSKALSDLRVDDCEAYKDFLKNRDPRLVGERFPRHSPRWRPHSVDDEPGAPLQVSSSGILRRRFAHVLLAIFSPRRTVRNAP